MYKKNLVTHKIIMIWFLLRFLSHLTSAVNLVVTFGSVFFFFYGKTAAYWFHLKGFWASLKVACRPPKPSCLIFEGFIKLWEDLRSFEKFETSAALWSTNLSSIKHLWWRSGWNGPFITPLSHYTGLSFAVGGVDGVKNPTWHNSVPFLQHSANRDVGTELSV